MRLMSATSRHTIIHTYTAIEDQSDNDDVDDLRVCSEDEYGVWSSSHSGDVRENAVAGDVGEIAERGKVELDREVRQCPPSDFKSSS